MQKLIKATVLIAAIFVFSAAFGTALKAETEAEAKTQAISSAISQAETTAAAPAEKEETSIFNYRQKLSSEIEVSESPFKHEVDSYVRFMPTRSLCSQPGKISVIKAASEYSFTFKAFGKLPVQLGVAGEDIDINANDAVPVSLPSHLTNLTFGAETTLPFFNLDKTYIRLGITPGFYSSNWNFKANSFNLGSRAFAIYQPNEKLTLVAGVAVFPGFEDPICPVAGVIYKPNDRLVFNLIPDRPYISYKLNEIFTVYTEGGLSGGEFKVTKDTVNGAALAYNEVHVGAGIEIKINKHINTYLSSGRMFHHYLKYRDSLGKVDMKDNTYSEFRVEIAI